MAAQTPIAGSLTDTVIGSLRMETARFASVANGDTYVCGISGILVVSSEGNTTTPSIATTFSGSTLTFAVTSGPALGVSVIIIGY